MSRQSLRSLPQDELEPLKKPYRFERGQTLVEYALIIALVAIVVIAALVLLGPAIANAFNHITNSL